MLGKEEIYILIYLLAISLMIIVLYSMGIIEIRFNEIFTARLY